MNDHGFDCLKCKHFQRYQLGPLKGTCSVLCDPKTGKYPRDIKDALKPDCKGLLFEIPGGPSKVELTDSGGSGAKAIDQLGGTQALMIAICGLTDALNNCGLKMAEFIRVFDKAETAKIDDAADRLFKRGKYKE